VNPPCQTSRELKKFPAFCLRGPAVRPVAGTSFGAKQKTVQSLPLHIIFRMFWLPLICFYYFETIETKKSKICHDFVTKVR
jgi:hypothetical protein